MFVVEVFMFCIPGLFVSKKKIVSYPIVAKAPIGLISGLKDSTVADAAPIMAICR